ncbi:MAG: WYL domain-containing protein [Clostridia bacterium]|nr:WYL domain-containing protein [Clostridia bacterium]
MDIEHEPGDHLYRRRSREFSVAELKLIVDSMASSKVLTPELTEELTGKLAKLCSKHERDYLKKKIFLDGRVKSQNKKIPSYIKILNEGIIRQRWVAFRYYKYDNNKKKVYYYGGKHRRVRPAALLVNNDGYYLLGYDKRDRRKLYRIDRMSHVVVHAERFESLPEKVDNKMAQLAFSTGNPFLTRRSEVTRVKIRFSDSVVDNVLDKFGFAVRMVPEDGSHFTVTTNLEPTSEFLAWIFSLGSAAEILEPRTVRTSMSFKLMMENWKYDK